MFAELNSLLIQNDSFKELKKIPPIVFIPDIGWVVAILFLLIYICAAIIGFIVFLLMRIERSKNPDFITKSTAILKTKEVQSPRQDSKRVIGIEPTNASKLSKVISLLKDKGLFNSFVIFAFFTLAIYIINLEIIFQLFFKGSFSFLKLFTGFNNFNEFVYEILVTISIAWLLPFMLLIRPKFYGKRMVIEPLTIQESLVLIGTGGIWVVLIFSYFLLITIPALLISILIPFRTLEDHLDDFNVISCNICKEKVGVIFEEKIAECPNCNQTIEYNLFSNIAKIIGQLFLSIILSFILFFSILTILSILI